MSSNRSVQAAQRRRAGPPDPQPPGRSGPQPSINSAQMFANQARPGSGPNIPPSRFPGPPQQQYQQPPQQYQQPSQQFQQQYMEKKEGVSGITKMTIPQAITLITLRLGALENKMMNLESEVFNGQNLQQQGLMEGAENMVLVDKSVIQSLSTRIETLEKRPLPPSQSSTNTNNSLNAAATAEINAVKQQLETIKPVVVQTKNTSVSLVKENKELKTQIENLKKEIIESRELIYTLQNAVTDSNQKINELSMASQNFEGIIDSTNLNELSEQSINELNELDVDVIEGLNVNLTDFDNDNATLELDTNEIVGTNLKQLIENEMNNIECEVSN